MQATADTLTGAPDVDPFAAASRENFPVVSHLIRRDLRPAVVAFYRFARAADDVADDPHLVPARKLERLTGLQEGIEGRDGESHAAALARAVADHPRRDELLACASQLLCAFRQDAAGAVYPTWESLRAYCAMSAEPVGRFLLHLHLEGDETHRSSDALCSALQVLNHLQDLRSDRDLLGRIYLPDEWLRGAGADPSHLSEGTLSPAARQAVDRALDACDLLLLEARPLPGLLRSRGLRAQAAATLFLARRLSDRLRRSDPLARRVRPGWADFALAGALGTWRAVWRRP